MAQENKLQVSASPHVRAELTTARMMLDVIMHFYNRAKAILRSGCPVLRLNDLAAIEEMLRMKYKVPNEELSILEAIRSRMDEELSRLEREYH